MFLIRQAKVGDVETLFKLAKMVHFINLPADKNIIEEKVRWSATSFEAVRQGAPDPDAAAQGFAHLGGAAGCSPQFMFVVEDPATGNPLGCSAVISRMGVPGHPNVYIKLRKREFFSVDLQMGTSHTTAQITLDESGPTEIGALIVAPSYRGHPARLGKQLSFIRFHYIGLRRERFKDDVVAELMAPLTDEGRNAFWEHLGRRFINLSYDEADRFCAKSREFMTSLLPRDEMYLTILPPEVRKLVGQVGADTVPARAMLERLGFEQRDLIDPFDAGPILQAKTDGISLVKETSQLQLGDACEAGDCDQNGIVSVDEESLGGFRAVTTPFKVDAGRVRAPRGALDALGAGDGANAGATPFPAKKGAAAGTEAAQA